MTFEVVADAERAYNFACEFFPLGRSSWQKGLCQLKDGETVAAVVYQDFNGQNIFMHVAARPGRKWMTRHLLREAFKFPFETCRAQRITGWVNADNQDARRLNEHLGFKVEATLQWAGPQGQDVLLYRMFNWECRYARAHPNR